MQDTIMRCSNYILMTKVPQLTKQLYITATRGHLKTTVLDWKFLYSSVF